MDFQLEVWPEWGFSLSHIAGKPNFMADQRLPGILHCSTCTKSAHG
jgi:hypothetical protein